MSRQGRSFRGFVVFHGVIGKSEGAGKALELEGEENEMGVDAEHVVVFVEGDLFHRRVGKPLPLGFERALDALNFGPLVVTG
jgi:hypothetical protein